MAAPDMDVIKDIPGYKVILKAIIKSQIQQLVEQLAAHTDEESVILTASVSDGTLSHLGSESGKGFLEEQEDVKSHFLGFCLKRHHKQKQAEKEKERLQALTAQTHIPGQMDMGPGPRRPRMPYHGGPRQSFTPQGFGTRPPGLRHEPYHVPKNIRRPSPSSSDVPQNPPAENANFTVVKSEPVDENSGLSSDTVNKDDENTNSSNPNESAEDKSGDDSQVDPQTVKVESISETEFELEITGVEPGVSSQSMPQDTSTWEQNVSMAMSFDPSIGATGSLADMSSQQGYNSNPFQSVYQEGSSTSNENQHVCKICGKSFKLSGNLKQHLVIHSGEKPFDCKLCGKRFNLKGNLKKHMAVHYITQNQYPSLQ